MKLSTVIVAVALAGSAGAVVAAEPAPAPATPGVPAAAQTEEPLGSRLYDQYCLACHPKKDPSKPDANATSPDQAKVPNAPPMPIMSAPYRQRAGSDKSHYVASVVAFLKAPAAERALDQSALKQFGAMKPLTEKYPHITEGELTTIAEWMWDHYAPTSAAQGQQSGQQTGQQQKASLPAGMQMQGSMGLTTGLPANDSPIAKAEGAGLFKKFCNDCHPKSDSPEAGEQPQVSPDQMKVQAPPMSMMSAHYRQVTGGDKNRYITRMLDFVRHPSADKSVDPRSIEHFGLKKPVTDKHPDITDADIATIAEWLWEYYKDVWIIRLPAHGVWSD